MGNVKINERTPLDSGNIKKGRVAVDEVNQLTGLSREASKGPNFVICGDGKKQHSMYQLMFSLYQSTGQSVLELLLWWMSKLGRMDYTADW